jgi:Fic family protein
MPKYIYQQENWSHFTWDEKTINSIFGEVRNLQGRLTGQMQSIGFSRKEEATLNTLTLDVVKSSEIEGERLNFQQVRSSIAIKLGLEAGGLVSSNRNVEGVVEMILDATRNYLDPITDERLFGWHAALFPDSAACTKLKLGVIVVVKCRLSLAQWVKRECITRLFHQIK